MASDKDKLQNDLLPSLQAYTEQAVKGLVKNFQAHCKHSYELLP